MRNSYIINKSILNKPCVTLHKMNRELIGELMDECLISITDSIDTIDTVTVSVPKFYIDNSNMKKFKYLMFDEIKEERLLCVNNERYFIIKDIDEDEYSDNTYLNITGYSLEHKLGKIDIEVEDIGFYLISSDEDNNIFSLSKYMNEETGWSFGFIDEEVLMSSSGVEKMRWQESVNTNWYDYIMKNVREQFECVPMFDTFNKVVNLYHINSFGDSIKICLSYDSYIKDMDKKRSSQDLTTRMKLVGNEDMDIVDATPSGYKYVENYSYFIENKEMSSTLISHLKKYEEMVAKRTITWRELRELKANKYEELLREKTELYIVYSEIKAKESMLEAYRLNKDDVNAAIIVNDITELKDQKIILEIKVEELEDEINNLQNSILEINKLCKRETCTDDNGYLVFTEKTLNELKDFVYYGTYSNDAFLDVNDLISSGKRELDLVCKPTFEIEVDTINFMSRIIDNGFRQHWTGDLSLGDIVSLQDNEDNEYLRYLVSVSINYKDNSLVLKLSNKKTNIDNTKVISDWLSQSSRNLRTINSNKYLWIQHKKNRINLDYIKGGVSDVTK